MWNIFIALMAFTLSIDDVTQLEGNTLTTMFIFTVSLSAPATRMVTVDFATADVTARLS